MDFAYDATTRELSKKLEAFMDERIYPAEPVFAEQCEDNEHGGHAELVFADASVLVGDLIGQEGTGFAIAQACFGPGRIQRRMRSICIAERAIVLICQRASDRGAFYKPLADHGVIRDWIAESRIRVERLRLLVLKTVWLIYTVWDRGADTKIQAIKIATRKIIQGILAQAIQIHGSGGPGQDIPLAPAFAGMRTLRFTDGPDEVHRNSLGRREHQRLGRRS